LAISQTKGILDILMVKQISRRKAGFLRLEKNVALARLLRDKKSGPGFTPGRM
jgi:hypothetical protein